MKTPSPTKHSSNMSPRCSPTSPDKGTIRRPGMKSPPMKFSQPMRSPNLQNPLTVMGHSMINRSGDQEGELNLDLRLITGRMAQTLHSYEDVAAKLYLEHINEVEDHLDEIDSPILKVQIKSVLEDYKRLAIERENILSTLEKWFDNCTDEFMDELEELESSLDLEGGDSLSGHIEQAKDIISKIKFINHKIVDFQSNGMSTQKLIAQKKNLESELMKKKIIVDNTQNGTEVLAVWRNRIDNVVNMIKDSEASEIEKALLDMQLAEAVEHINSHIIALERTSKRTGVLFRNVKELEVVNDELANENSFLKQRLSKLDKQFKESMLKKVQKLDKALDELGDVKHLQNNGHGANSDDINRKLRRGGVSLEMELIDNYQEKIHVLDGENKDLITKLDNLELENEEYKEELTSLEAKYKSAIKDQENMKNTEIASHHPLVKLDTATDDTYSLGGLSSTLFGDNNSYTAKGSTAEGKRRNTVEDKRRGSAMVSMITMQDGKELDNFKKENDCLKAQLNKTKNSLNTVRRQSVKPRMSSKNTQTIMIISSSEDEESEESSNDESPKTDQQETEVVEEEVISQEEIIPPKAIKRKTKKKVSKLVEEKQEDKFNHPPNSDSSELSEEEEAVEDDEGPKLTQDEINKRKQHRADSMVASLKSFVRKKDREKLRAERMKNKDKGANEPKPSSENKIESPPEESSESESEMEIEEKAQTPADLAAERKAKQKKKKVKKPKRRVKFKEAVIEEPEPPSFKRVSTPNVIEEDPVNTLTKIKEEIKEFLSYGNKFMNDIHRCLMETADADIASTMNQYSEMEQKVIGLETSLDIMLYGVDLGMYLVTPTQARPEYSPLPFENKLYFQENLSKYLREKYPQLNVSAMKLFDPELDPVKSLLPETPMPQNRISTLPGAQPYPEFTNQQIGSFNNFMMPLTTTPEPIARTSPRKISRKKTKPIKREMPIGKIEEVIANLRLGALSAGKKKNDIIADDRSFTEIVDQVMPKEIKLEYLKLIQPTHDTMGKKQYINKVKRGVMKVKDLLDLINLNSNQGVIKGLPSNSLGQPRTRQTKVHQTNLEVGDLLGPGSPLATTKHSAPENIRYKNKIARYDERVRASLEDYNVTSVEDLKGSGSLTVMEVPLTPKTLYSKRSNEKKQEGSKVELNPSVAKEEMFDLSKSNTNIDQWVVLGEPEKRSFLPIVTQNLIPHFETKKNPPSARQNYSKKLAPNLSHHSYLDKNAPKLSDLLNIEFEKPKQSAIGKLPKIDDHRQIDQNQSFP